MMPLSQRIQEAISRGVSKGADLDEMAALVAVTTGCYFLMPGVGTLAYGVGIAGIGVKNVVCEFFDLAKKQEKKLEKEANRLLDKIKVLSLQHARDQENLIATQETLQRSYAIELAAQTIIVEYEEEQQELLQRLQAIEPQFTEVQTMCSNLNQMAKDSKSTQEIKTAIEASISRIKEMRKERELQKAHKAGAVCLPHQFIRV